IYVPKSNSNYYFSDEQNLNKIAMSLLQEGINKGLISISDDQKTIKYLYQDKSRNFANPEEKVQAETFLKLILEYGYPVEHIEQFRIVTMGADKREADIIVHQDKN